jgi:hypothetical protein
MSDVYVYYFTAFNDKQAEVISNRPATLEAIKSRGVPIMRTQLVVDHSEIDAEGFLLAIAANDSCVFDNIAAQIWSLEARATSRDNEANASSDGIEQYMLRLESRELRKQARSLKTGRTKSTADERDLLSFEEPLLT